MSKSGIQTKLKPLEEKLQSIYEEEKSSGLAVIVTNDEEIIYSNTFGYRDVENEIPVTLDTIFDIGSVSKAFTSTAIAMLVDEDKLKWDKPIRQFFPKLQFKDEVANNRITIRDMLSHRTGLPRHDLIWYLDENFTYEKLLNRLPHLDFSEDIRYEYQYNNLMYNTSAKIVEDMTGLEFHEFIDEEIFAPLEMENSTLIHDDAVAKEEMAKPYKIIDGKPKLIDYYEEKLFGPGGVKSTVKDLANWLQFHINKGKFDDKVLLGEKNAEQLYEPTTLKGGNGLPAFNPDKVYSKMPCYGLGWSIEVYRGHEMVQHGGNIDGFSSLASFLPDEKFGIAVLANENGSILPIAVTLQIYDQLLDLEKVPWVDKGMELMDQVRAQNEDAKQGILDQAEEGTKPSKELSAYEGIYTRDGYPPFEIKLVDEDELKFITPRLEFEMDHIHYDSFLVVIEKFDIFLNLRLGMNKNGEISKFEVAVDDKLPPLIFTREAETIDKETMEELTGTFSFLNREFEINLVNDHLEVKFPNQPPAKLIPERDMRFKIEENEHTELKFIEEEGQYNEIKLQMMGTMREAKRKIS